MREEEGAADIPATLFSTSVLKWEQGIDPLAEPFKPTEKIYRWPRLCQQMAVMKSEYFSPLHVPSHLFDDSKIEIKIGTKWVTIDASNGNHWKFPLATILPKVHMPRIVKPKSLPRDVEVNRLRQRYASLDLVECLTEVGVMPEDLHPTEEQYLVLSESAFQHFLPLSYFDSTFYDANTPEVWMELATVGDELFELPAKVFLPKNQSLMEYAWQLAAVSDYSAERHTWKATTIADAFEYEVAPLQIMFLADNPKDFALRNKMAAEARDRAESLTTMESIVDCMILQDINENQFYPNPLADYLVTTIESDPEFLEQMHQELYLLYEHVNASYEFVKYVKLMPKEFPAFRSDLVDSALPTVYVSPKSQAVCKMIRDLLLDIRYRRYKVLGTTMYYIPEGIEAMSNVTFECRAVERMAIFVSSFVKPLPLTDFLQSQEENSTNVCNYLTMLWPEKVSAGIRYVLSSLGKGYLDITLNRYIVYEMCKISRFILETKFRMETSMQLMLEESITSFTTFLVTPCQQFLHLKDNYIWPNNFIETAFPCEKPIFELIIGINQEVEEVEYSTDPKEFEPSILDVYRRGLEKSSAVRLIDAETMTKLHFSPYLFILTVELIEDLFVETHAQLELCYSKAVIPLNAYAKLYKRFVEFYILDVNAYMREYESTKQSSLQVKSDILEHKRQKEELREILPAEIVIGPFLIIVDPLKQFLIKKHIDIIRRLFEYYVRRMSDINEDLMEQCSEVYRKIADRPQSIEHLYEIRDFGVTVPERVEQLKGDIQIMWLEYEILDIFFYNLSDHQFSLKWQVYGWPHLIITRLSTLREEQKNDIEDFKRLHLSEIIVLEERLESLNEEIQAFSLQFDPDKVAEVSVDIKKTWKIITELSKVAHVLQSRQRLFDMEELSLEFLESIIEGFLPYRTLWSTCSDFQKLEEATIGNPIINIDVPEVWKSLAELRAVLQKSYEVFSEKPEVQGVATAFMKKIDEFVPVIQCLEWLKNEHWLFIHWQELAHRSGMEIKYSVALNFQYLMRKGIMLSLDLVEEISQKAESDADAIRKKLEEEEAERERERQAILNKKMSRKCRRDIL